MSGRKQPRLPEGIGSGCTPSVALLMRKKAATTTSRSQHTLRRRRFTRTRLALRSRLLLFDRPNTLLSHSPGTIGT